MPCNKAAVLLKVSVSSSSVAFSCSLCSKSSPVIIYNIKQAQTGVLAATEWASLLKVKGAEATRIKVVLERRRTGNRFYWVGRIAGDERLRRLHGYNFQVLFKVTLPMMKETSSSWTSLVQRNIVSTTFSPVVICTIIVDDPQHTKQEHTHPVSLATGSLSTKLVFLMLLWEQPGDTFFTLKKDSPTSHMACWRKVQGKGVITFLYTRVLPLDIYIHVSHQMQSLFLSLCLYHLFHTNYCTSSVLQTQKDTSCHTKTSCIMLMALAKKNLKWILLELNFGQWQLFCEPGMYNFQPAKSWAVKRYNNNKHFWSGTT